MSGEYNLPKRRSSTVDRPLLRPPPDMRTFLARKSAALLLAAAFVLAGARAAEAGRAPARKATVAGAKIKGWKSGNTRFTHESLKGPGGHVIHFERTARKVGQRGGTTKVSGKTWRSEERRVGKECRLL